MSAKAIDFDRAQTCDLTLHSGQDFVIGFSIEGASLDLVQSKIYLSDVTRTRVLKTYSIDNGLEVYDTTKLRWTGNATDLGSEPKAVYDAYLVDVDNKRRTFQGAVKITKAWPYS